MRHLICQHAYKPKFDWGKEKENHGFPTVRTYKKDQRFESLVGIKKSNQQAKRPKSGANMHTIPKTIQQFAMQCPSREKQF